MMALKMRLVRVDLAGMCCVLGVTAETVLVWLRRAAHQADALTRHLLRHLPVTYVQLGRDGELYGAQARVRGGHGRRKRA